MPVPLTDLGDNFGYILAVGVQLPYPEVSALMFDVINLWSQIDMNTALVISKVVGADPEVGMAMYQAVSGAEQKAKQLRAAMLLRADAVTNDLIQSAIDSCDPSKKTRNMFAHDLWGHLTPADGRLVSMSPAAFAKIYARPLDHRFGAGDQLRNDLSSQALVWEPAEFVLAAREARRCHSLIARFPFLFDHPSKLDMMGRILDDQSVRDRFAKKIKRWSTEDLDTALNMYPVFEQGMRATPGIPENQALNALLHDERLRR